MRKSTISKEASMLCGLLREAIDGIDLAVDCLVNELASSDDAGEGICALTAAAYLAEDVDEDLHRLAMSPTLGLGRETLEAITWAAGTAHLAKARLLEAASGNDEAMDAARTVERMCGALDAAREGVDKLGIALHQTELAYRGGRVAA